MKKKLLILLLAVSMIITYMPLSLLVVQADSTQTEQGAPESDQNMPESDQNMSESDQNMPESDQDTSAITENEEKPEEIPLEANEPSEEVSEKADDEENNLSLPEVDLRAEQNETVSYKGKRVGSAAGETTVFNVTSSDNKKYTGTCSKQGISMHTSGTAVVTRIGNNTKIAKILYYYCVQLGDKNWWTSKYKTNKVGKIIGMNNAGDTNVTKRRMIEAFCQIYNMGGTSWYNTITASSTGGWSTNTASKIKDYYSDISDKTWYKNLTVPDEFEVWNAASANNAQPFIMWAMGEEDDAFFYFRVQKVSTNANTANSPDTYSLANAVYGVYLDANCATPYTDDDGDAITLITDANGQTEVCEADVGVTYYIRELSPSNGFKIDATVYNCSAAVANDEDNPTVVTSKEPPHSYAYLNKKANVEVSGDDYSLAGAKYWLYDTEAHAQAAINAALAGSSIPTDGRITDTSGAYIELVTTASGDTQLVQIATGTYWAAEIMASRGFKIDSLPRTATVSEANIKQTPAKFESIEVADTYVQLKKVSSMPHYSHPENYSLAGAKYWLYDSEANAKAAINAALAGTSIPTSGRIADDDGNTLELVTGEDGNTQLAKVKAGTYYAAEIEASEGFLIDENVNSVTITKDNIKSNPALINSTEVPQTGYQTLEKKAAETTTNFLIEAPNNYKLENAKFEVYVDEALTKPAKDTDGNVITFTTDNNGKTPQYRTDIGDYWAKEVVAPKGYLLPCEEYDNQDALIYKVTVTKDNDESHPAVFHYTDDPTYGEPKIRVVKYDSKGVKDWSRLTGAYYQVSYYDIACWYKGGNYPTVEDLDPATVTYGKPTRKWIFKTRKMPTDDPTITQAGFDWQTDDVVASVLLDSPVTTAGGIKYKAGETVKSDPFYMEDGKRILPIGFYTIEEIKAPVGVSRNPQVVHGKIYQPEMGKKALDRKDLEEIEAINYDEVPQNVTIVIQKVDAETGENKPQGGGTTAPAMAVMNVALQALSDSGVVLDERLASFGSLAGAVYNVYFNNDEVRIPEIVGQIVTDENGYGKLTKRTLGRFKDRGENLEPGDYYIEEVSASPGYVIDKYVLDGTNTVEVSDHEIEVVADYDVDGEPVTKKIGGTFSSEELTGKVNYTGDVDNEVAVNGKINSRHVFKGRIEERNTYMFTFTTTSKDMPHNTEVSKTDITTGEELPGATLQIINSDGEVVENWVSTTEPHMIKALPSGTYTLREITAPYGYDIAEDVQFTIVDDVIYNKVEMKNKPLNVATQAVDAATKAHQGIFAAEETITDTVKVSGLYAGRTYKVSGVLMDKLTGEAIKDAEGNPLVAESEPFVATGDEMEVQVNFTVDSSLFTTDSIVVVFEKLYRTERIEGRDETNDFPGEEFPVELAKHEDLEDEEQSIHYGGIVGTVATDAASKSHNILADKDVTIVDVVEYKNLAPANEYEVKGELYDKTTGQLLGVTGSAKFTPKTPDGTVEVTFTFDASELKNHDLVAFEELYINGILINDHKNPEDEEQTVHVPEIRTTATDAETMAHVSYGNENVTIIDKVEYFNLIPGQEYTMSGVLMNKETGEPILPDGEEVRASTVFTPTEKDGVVDIIFEFNGVDLTGSTVVAFEECTVNGVAVAVHADLEDEAQNVDIPYIGTTAALVKKHVEDTVEYSNLTPGKYVMRGWLVNHKNGKKLIDSDGETEFEITEPHASGEVVVDLPIKGYKKLGGYSLTAFEELYYVAEIVGEDGTVTEQEVLVADHKDVEDEDQTVKIPGVKTGDTNKLYIFGGLFAVLVLVGGVYCFIRRRK